MGPQEIQCFQKAAIMFGDDLRIKGRQSRRSLLTVAVTLVTDPTGKRISFPCRTLDISESGLRLRGKVPPAPGSLIELIPVTRGGRYYRARVVWGRKIPSSPEVELGVALQGFVSLSDWLPRRPRAA